MKCQDLLAYQLRVMLEISIVFSIISMPMFLNTHLFMVIVGSLFNDKKVRV